jgi:hypothetical protein
MTQYVMKQAARVKRKLQDKHLSLNKVEFWNADFLLGRGEA